MPSPRKPAPDRSRRPKPKRTPRKPVDPVAAPEPTSAAARDEALLTNLASLRDLLAGGVVLTAQRVQDSLDDAVARGRMTRRDAEELAASLLAAGRQQTQDLIGDIEQLVGRGRSDLSTAKSITKGAVKGTSDLVLREVDRARRTAGLGQAFPILGYDELTAKQIGERLAELDAAELQRVREYEARHRDRKGVLTALDRALRAA